MEAGNAVKMEKSSTKQSKKRGPYSLHTVSNEAKVPRRTAYRQKQQTLLNASVQDASIVAEEIFSADQDSADDTKINDITSTSEPVDTYADEHDEDIHSEMSEPDLNEQELDESHTNKQLFEGCQLTMAISMLLIMTFAMRHSLSDVALEEMLILIHLHLPQVAPLFFTTSLQKFKGNFSSLKSTLSKFHYCSYCEHYNNENNDKCENCDKDIDPSEYFIGMSLTEQLQQILPGIYAYQPYHPSISL